LILTFPFDFSGRGLIKKKYTFFRYTRHEDGCTQSSLEIMRKIIICCIEDQIIYTSLIRWFFLCIEIFKKLAYLDMQVSRANILKLDLVHELCYIWKRYLHVHAFIQSLFYILVYACFIYYTRRSETSFLGIFQRKLQCQYFSIIFLIFQQNKKYKSE
jgi:hypothetical protein